MEKIIIFCVIFFLIIGNLRAIEIMGINPTINIDEFSENLRNYEERDNNDLIIKLYLRYLQNLIDALNDVEIIDIELIVEEQEPSQFLNDIYWALYFLSGNVKYIDYLIAIINNYHNETENEYYYLVARSAMLSMAINIITYSQVRDYLINNNVINNEIKEYVLNTTPEDIEMDTFGFIGQ
jgi:hypothetical protein